MIQQSIIFATDFSKRDTAAFKSACSLSLKAKSKLLIVYVKDPRELAMAESRRTDTKVEFAKYIPEDYAVNFDHVLRSGEPSEQILQLADESNASMIILGTHGRQGLNRVFQGSVAERVMRNSGVPVMTVRDPVKKHASHAIPQIVVPIDFSVFGYAALDFATRMAIAIGAELSIIYVDEHDKSDQVLGGRSEWSHDHREIWKQLKEYVPTSKKIDFTHKLLEGSPGKEIVNFANVHRSDFIILGTHGRSGLGRALMGSIAEHVVRHANCPVITVKPSKKRTPSLSA